MTLVDVTFLEPYQFWAHSTISSNLRILNWHFLHEHGLWWVSNTTSIQHPTTQSFVKILSFHVSKLALYSFISHPNSNLHIKHDRAQCFLLTFIFKPQCDFCSCEWRAFQELYIWYPCREQCIDNFQFMSMSKLVMLHILPTHRAYITKFVTLRLSLVSN